MSKRVFVLVLVLMVGMVFGEGLKMAPKYELQNLDGKKVSLEEALKNGPVVINFWASWCTPCKEEMPELNDLYKKYKDQGLQMHVISIDKGDGISKAKAHVKASDFEFEALIDKAGKMLKSDFNEKPNTVPYTFFVNRKGEITLLTKEGNEESIPLKGKQTIETFEEQIKHILK
ncbi:MAG: TlpA family protein disulfide reductase [Candidatus Delongbacteria bacterium]|nr:TlpA family protein disulfide reductase [Candidatus Delongbacteria bacterium]MBN2836642.1 TlpA family protein disulfide reductase [Candidatus Delongbacteria bacterium]